MRTIVKSTWFGIVGGASMALWDQVLYMLYNPLIDIAPSSARGFLNKLSNSNNTLANSFARGFAVGAVMPVVGDITGVVSTYPGPLVYSIM